MSENTGEAPMGPGSGEGTPSSGESSSSSSESTAAPESSGTAQDTGTPPPTTSFSYAHKAGIESTPAMEQASEKAHDQFANAAQKPEKQEETIEGMQDRLARMELRGQPTPGPHLTIDNAGIRQAADQHGYEIYLTEMQNLRQQIAVKQQEQRRRQFMAQAAPDIDEEPDEDPEPELVDG